jgi:signal transduction histidine kinase
VLLRRALDRWFEHQDEALAREAVSLKATVAATLFLGGLLPLLRYTPWLNDFFALELAPALIGWLPALLLIGALHLFDRRPWRRANYVLDLVFASYLELYLAALVAWSGPRGGPVFAALFLLTAAYHGHIFRTTPREPFMTLGTLVAVGGGMLLVRDTDGVAVLAVTGAAAVTAQLMVGTMALRSQRARRRHETLLAAVQAQMLADQDREVQRLSTTLTEVLGRNHDIKNALQSLAMNVGTLRDECRAAGTSGEVDQIADDMEEAVARIRHLVSDSKQLAVVGDPPAEPVEVLPVIESVTVGLCARFPRVRLRVADHGAAGLAVPMRGGSLTLRRVVENLLLNACEGDGSQGASTVELTVLRDPSGARLSCVIEDDGPGFARAQLEGPVEGFATTKPEGTGLGLYIVERLLRASGGSLERQNREGRGARVSFTLPLWSPEAQDRAAAEKGEHHAAKRAKSA